MGDWFVVDVDCHAETSLEPLIPYLEQPWRRNIETLIDREIIYHVAPSVLGDPSGGGRIKRDGPLDIPGVEAVARQLGVRRSVLAPPKDLFSLALHPQPDHEIAVAKAHARWITQQVLPHTGLAAYLYLPLRDPAACCALVEQFGDQAGVAGFVTASVRYEPLGDDRFVPVWASLEERGLPLVLHPAVPWRERPFEVFNKYASAYAFGTPFFHTVHLTNLVICGVLERFPGLRCLFLESGLSWIPFALHRLDNEYKMRTSEAPLLRKLPSAYIRSQCFFTAQPLEWAEERHLEALFDAVGRDQLVYASNYPKPDFDLPSRISDLAFLADEDRAAILHENARRVLRLEDDSDRGGLGL